MDRHAPDAGARIGAGTQTPLVSIITPAYNAAETIRTTIRSVLAQTYGNWEWLIVDDGSTDSTREIVRAVRDSRVKLLECPHAGHLGVARNRALRQARGELVAFVDADDIWLPGKLARQVDFFEAHPEAGLVFSKVRFLYEELGRIGRRSEPSIPGPNPRTLFAELCERNLIVASSAVFRRSLVETYGPMDEEPLQFGTEDYEMWLRFAARVPFGWLEEAAVIYRVDPRSLSGNAVAITNGRILALEKAFRRNAAWPERRFAARRQLWLGEAQLRDGTGDHGRSALWRAARAEPANLSAWLWLASSFLGPAATRRLRRLAYRVLSSPAGDQLP